MAEDEQSIRDRLIWILQNAHAGELAAAYAYQGHRRSLRRADERDELQRIEEAEWLHRAHVAAMLVELGAPPRARSELLMATIGRFFGALCFVSGWFAPMYAAGRLEATNVGECLNAREAAAHLGLTSIDAYLASETGGLGVQQAQRIGAAANIDAVLRSGLRGRGGRC